MFPLFTFGNAISDAEYKALAEQRVSNQTGTTAVEVLLVTLTGVAVSAIAAGAHRANAAQHPLDARVIEWLCLVPSLLVITTAHDFGVTVALALAVFGALALSLLLNKNSSGGSNKSSSDDSSSGKAGASLYDGALALLKGSLMLQTVVAILAVDFTPFPARFMKTETFGVSLMDVGVGAFVFTSALSHAVAAFHARAKKATAQLAAAAAGSCTVTEAGASSTPRLMMERLTQLRSCVPLFVLGCIRLVTVKGSEYQEHVTEYGVHWNFFFTLGALPVVVTLAHIAVEPLIGVILFFFGAPTKTRIAPNALAASKKSNTSGSGSSGEVKQRSVSRSLSRSSSSRSRWSPLDLVDLFAGALLLAVHQTLLSSYGVTEYVMSPHRRTPFEANKEGIVSSVGYAALFLLSSSLYGLCVLPRLRNNSGGNNGSRACATASFALGAAFIVASVTLQGSSVQPISRRLCNAPYVVLCIGTGFAAYALCALLSSVTPQSFVAQRQGTRDMLSCVHENQLFVFLVANLCTGTVNKAMRTLFAPPLVAYGVLAVYVTVVLFVAVQLANRGIRVKV